MLSLKYPQFNLGFSWIVLLLCGYKYNTTIAIRMGRVLEDYPKICPSCGEGNQSFEHWIFKCDALASFRWNSSRAGVYSIYVFKSPARGINFTLIK